MQSILFSMQFPWMTIKIPAVPNIKRDTISSHFSVLQLLNQGFKVNKNHIIDPGITSNFTYQNQFLSLKLILIATN